MMLATACYFRNYDAMKLVTFSYRGSTSFGCLASGGVVDLTRQLPGAYSDLKGFLAAGDAALAQAAGLDADYELDDVTLLPPVPNPDKIICVAVNYFEDGEIRKTVADHPLLFLRLAASQTGHRAPLIQPAVSEKLDFEGELAVVIGRLGRNISEAAAFEHVAGYSCYNDGSVRDWQKHSSQFTAGKNFFRTGGFGPWIVTADEVGDPTNLDLETRVNGVVKQKTNTARMIFSIPRLIAYISTFTPLVPGDVIASGTPSGFGSMRSPPEFLRPGDVVEVEIARVGTLVNPIVAEADAVF